jgi:hypothetical protein
MHFETVYDLAQSGYTNWRFAANGLIFVVFAVFSMFFSMFFPRAAAVIFRITPRLARGVFVASVIFTVGAFAMTYAKYLAARTALLSGDYTVVEGMVTDFGPIKLLAGPPGEGFTVAGQKFTCWGINPEPGFNSTHLHAITNGIYVRVTHNGNAILRLEIGH